MISKNVWGNGKEKVFKRRNLLICHVKVIVILLLKDITQSEKMHSDHSHMKRKDYVLTLLPLTYNEVYHQHFLSKSSNKFKLVKM